MPSHSSALVAGLVCLSAAVVVVSMPWLAAGEVSGSDCQTSCGGVDIPFPFGMGPDHCWLPGFEISCKDSGNGVLKPFMDTINEITNAKEAEVEVLSISLEKGEVKVLNNISSYCYDAESQKMVSNGAYLDLANNYTFSTTANKFTVVGCRALAYIGDLRRSPTNPPVYQIGCVSLCFYGKMSLNPCSGMGCCQTTIDKGRQSYQVWFDADFMNISGIHDGADIFGRCSFAVLMDSSNFTSSTSFSNSSSPSAFNSSRGGVAPVVLDWSIGDEDCKKAVVSPGYACRSINSFCSDAASGRGYICNCSQGFHGNPYLPNGCQGISAGLLVALIAFLSTQVFLNKENKKRQRFFEQHGGQMLSRILETEGNRTFKLYDRGDLVKATRGFNKSNIVGEGAHGSVYKATLGGAAADASSNIVAVKRCKQIDETRTKEFVQELVVLCRANHKNIVRLLGCCLHFEAPMLVYEFVPNGTLGDLLYGRPRRRVTLPTRLRIAAEIAEALAHLHSPPYPTLHGDIKPQNILLGKGWIAKVSDFGCSTINDNVQVVPKGTLAYLDPEFLQDAQITEKTDVYSFGVVLIELLTGKNPQERGWKNLIRMFQNCMENSTLSDLLDADIVEEEGSVGLIYAAAKLVNQCIVVPGKARPAMAEVAEELRRFSDKMPESPEAKMALEVEVDRHS